MLQGDETPIPKFTEYLYNNCMGLSFTMAANATSVAFLDLNLCVGRDNKVVTCTYRKSNASNTILHAHSHQPRHTIENILVGEMLRARHNC